MIHLGVFLWNSWFFEIYIFWVFIDSKKNSYLEDFLLKLTLNCCWLKKLIFNGTKRVYVFNFSGIFREPEWSRKGNSMECLRIPESSKKRIKHVEKRKCTNWNWNVRKEVHSIFSKFIYWPKAAGLVMAFFKALRILHFLETCLFF